MSSHYKRVKPGSTAARCVGYLKGMKPGAEVSTCMLAAAIGHNWCRLSNCLQSLRTLEVLRCRKAGRRVFWRLGPTPVDWVEPAHPKPARPRYDKPRVVQQRRLPVSSVWDLGQQGR